MWRPDEDLEIGACFKIATIRVDSGPPPPSGSRNSQNLRFPREIGHLPPILLVGGRGGVREECLTPALFWPSANPLSWRKALPTIAVLPIRYRYRELNDAGIPGISQKTCDHTDLSGRPREL